MAEHFKKSDEFVDCALEVMNGEVAAYIKFLVGAIQKMDPKFPLQEVKSLQDFMENGYAKDAHPKTVVGEEKVVPEVEKEIKVPEKPRT